MRVSPPTTTRTGFCSPQRRHSSAISARHSVRVDSMISSTSVAASMARRVWASTGSPSTSSVGRGVSRYVRPSTTSKTRNTPPAVKYAIFVRFFSIA